MQTSTPTFRNLLLMWFPVGQELPRGYLMDTSEEALLIQDWLKLKMIRSRLDLKGFYTDTRPSWCKCDHSTIKQSDGGGGGVLKVPWPIYLLYYFFAAGSWLFF